MEIETILIPCISLIMLGRKLNSERTDWAKNRLNSEMNRYKDILKQFPQGKYFLLDEEQQRIIDERSVLVDCIRDEFATNAFAHLWSCIPKEQRRELEIKYRIVELTLNKIPQNPYNFKPT